VTSERARAVTCARVQVSVSYFSVFVFDQDYQELFPAAFLHRRSP
jgi:hypothetical protein